VSETSPSKVIIGNNTIVENQNEIGSSDEGSDGIIYLKSDCDEAKS